MNKDVIYIEPEDDITDILTKLTSSQQKVVALVPPKKAGVLRSAVNIKLINKTARDAEKVAVIVTADPSLVKLAAAARIPVAKTLQSRPAIPTAEAVAAGMAAEQVIKEDLSDPDQPDKKPGTDSKDGDKKSQDDKKDKDKDASKPTDDKKDKKKNKKAKQVPTIEKYRKWIIIGVVVVVLIAGFLIWALAFAPAAKIAVSVKTTPNSFSENITLVTGNANEDVEHGKFLIEEQKTERKLTQTFTATGQKDVGSRATGQLVIYTYFSGEGAINIPSGATFTHSGLSYSADSGTALSWDGTSTCENENDTKSLVKDGCLISKTINVTAVEPGDKYNISAQSTGWSSSVGDVSASSRSAFSGGTSDVKTIVTQADVDKAKAAIKTPDEDASKDELIKQFSNQWMVISDSFKQAVGNVTSSPAVGEEVASGTTPTATVVVVSAMSAIDKVHIEQFITVKSNLSDTQKIYDLGEPYFERFTDSGGDTYSAKLKTTVQVGPKITEEEVLEKSKGRKVGEVQSLLKSIEGISDVNITTSFFWVNSIPNDPNKITIELKEEK